MKKLLKITFTLIFTTILLLGFALPLNPAGNWYQQFLPSIGGRTILDITFLDSLTGYTITSISSDTSYILKTTNGGDNWIINYRAPSFIFRRVQFLNNNTGYVCGINFIKTTNNGLNWSLVSSGIFAEDMHVLNADTAWYADPNSLVGGVFRTINGGLNWDRQLDIGSQNPTNIYFYDKDTGFAAENVLYKTTNSGVNWTQLPTGGGFSDMYFVNSLTGWKCSGSMKKTTDGGLNWVTQVLPSGGNFLFSQITAFKNLNKDTIWGVGSTIITGIGNRAVILRTVNGGNNWLFQVPDSNINIFQYQHIDFAHPLIGWAYSGLTGIHTTSGGDPIWLTGITQTSNEIPKDFKLYQNYPNPFNPKTIIKYEILPNVKHGTSNVKLIVFDITGRHIMDLVNTRQSSGTYEVDFSGNNYSSGVYFYSLTVDDKKIDTKKMLLIK